MSNILSIEVSKAITTKSTAAYMADFGKSIDQVWLEDIRDSVKAIPDNAIPKQSSYALFAKEMVQALNILCVDHIAPKTLANKRAMAKLACVEALENRALALCAVARLAKATTKAQKASAEKAVKKAAAALADMGTSLDKASVAGREIVDEKTNTIPGFQKPKVKAERKAKPDKGGNETDKAKRTADKELILQALDNVVDIHGKGDKATARQREQALAGVAHVAAMIVKYLPEDMRTL